MPLLDRPGSARLRRSGLPCGLLLAVTAAAPVATMAQEAPAATCSFAEGTAQLNSIVLAGGARITYVSRPRIRCSDGVRIEADSAVAYSSQNLSQLFGNVRYRDDTRTLNADEARYFSRTGRLQASGSVVLEDEARGTVVRDGDLVYLRQTEYRDQEEITVTIGPDGVRPRARILMTGAPAPDPSVTEAPMDSSGAPPAPDPDDFDALARTAAMGDSAALAALEAAVAAGDSTALEALERAFAFDASEEADSLGPDDPEEFLAALAAADSAAAADPARADTLPPPGPAIHPPRSDTLPVEAAPPTDTLPPVPTDVEADRLFLVGDGYFRATGRVIIDRDSLHATSDSATYDEAAQRMLLEGNAVVTQASFDLSGQDVNVAMPGGEIRSIRARRDAVLVGEDILVRAPLIDILMADGAMDRLVAARIRPEFGAEPDSALMAQPVAEAETFVLRADSLDVRAPGQALDRIFAVGRARGESSARDSLNVDALPPSALTDWMEGDTVVARFASTPRDPSDRAAEADTARDAYTLEELTAAGNARSLYRLLPSDSTSRPGIDPPAVHYVTGARITIAMSGGDVELMDVEGPTRGYHLEPLRAGIVADTAAVVDSGAVVDTAGAPDAAGAAPTRTGLPPTTPRPDSRRPEPAIGSSDPRPAAPAPRRSPTR